MKINIMLGPCEYDAVCKEVENQFIYTFFNNDKEAYKAWASDYTIDDLILMVFGAIDEHTELSIE